MNFFKIIEEKKHRKEKLSIIFIIARRKKTRKGTKGKTIKCWWIVRVMTQMASPTSTPTNCCSFMSCSFFSPLSRMVRGWPIRIGAKIFDKLDSDMRHSALSAILSLTPSSAFFFFLWLRRRWCRLRGMLGNSFPNGSGLRKWYEVPFQRPIGLH